MIDALVLGHEYEFTVIRHFDTVDIPAASIARESRTENKLAHTGYIICVVKAEVDCRHTVAARRHN